MDFNPSPEGFDFNLKVLRDSNQGHTILASKLNDDRKYVIQCIKTSLNEEDVSCYIKQIQSINTEYIYSDCLKFYPTYKAFISVTPFFEKSLDKINPLDYFTANERRNKLFFSIVEILRLFDNHSLIHGDLKTSNIFLSDEGYCVIGDYYKYKLLKKTFPSVYLADRIYYSPEIINNKEITIKSDIWSLGCIIYYCCSGRSPFCSNTTEEVNENINKVKYKPLTDEFEVYNEILSKIFLVDVKKRISISELLVYLMNDDNNLPVPIEEEIEIKNGDSENILLPTSINPSSVEKNKIEIYNVENKDIDIMTSEDFNRIWIELIHFQWSNNKQGMLKCMDYIKAVKEQGSALDRFIDKLINYIEYLPLLWSICKDFIDDYYIRSSSICKVSILPIYKYPFILNDMKSEESCIQYCRIIGDKILVVEKQKHRREHSKDTELYKKVEKAENNPSENKKRIIFSEEIKDISDEISDPVKIFTIFLAKHSTPEIMKNVKIPLQYNQQYSTFSKFININPVQSGYYTSISITPDLPKGLKLNKTTGRIHGFHRIKNTFNGKFTVTAYINKEEVNQSTFWLIIKKKAIILVEKKSPFQPYLYLKYKHKHYSFKVGEEIKEIKPKYTCENPSFSIISEVPPGLKINEKTGSISGSLSQYFSSFSLIVNMTNGYESTSKEILISCSANGKKDVKEWIIPIAENKNKTKDIIFETDKPISIAIPNIVNVEDKKNLVFEPSLPKDILEYNYHNCVVKGVSSKALPKTHYVVKNKETKKVVYEFDLEVRLAFKFTYPKDKYSFKIGDKVNINPNIAVDKKDDDSFTYKVGCDRKLPNCLTLDRNSGLICGIPTDYVWKDDYEIIVQSNIGTKTFNLTLFTGEKPKAFNYKEKVFHCLVADYVCYIPVFEGRCCEFRIVEGELPIGFSLNRWNGLISGITYKTGDYKLKVRCENELGYIEEDVAIEVSNRLPSNVRYDKSLYQFIVNQPIDPIIPKIYNKGDYYFIVHSNNLPSGLSIDNKTGIISGTPTEICKNEKNGIMRNEKGEEKKCGNKVGRNVVVEYKERNSYYAPISLFFHIGKLPQLFKYGDKNECIIFRSRYFIITSTYDDCECIFSIVDGKLPSGFNFNIFNGSIYGRTYDPVKSYNVTVRCENVFGFMDVKLKISIHEYLINETKYDDRCYYLCQNTVIEPIKPFNTDIDGECDISKAKLPPGLSIDKKGIITGNPSTESDVCDYEIHFNGIKQNIITTVKICVGNKPNFELKYEKNGICRCGYGREFHFCLLNDQNEIKKSKGFFSIQPDLPIGMRLNRQTGEISGISESENDDCHYKVSFENHFGKVSTEIEIISKTPPNPISYPEPYYIFDLNTPISITSLKYEGNDLIFSINPPLPEGLNIRPDCGIIDGKTPSKAYYQKHKVIASNDYGSSEADIVLYFGNADYFVYYDDIEYYISKDDEITIKPRICGKKCNLVIVPPLPDGLKMKDNCEIVGITKSTMKLTKYTIIQKNEYEYSTHLLLEIGDKPKPLDYEKNDLEVKLNEKFSFKPKEKYIGCKFTVNPPFPEEVQIHVINGRIYGKTGKSLSKTNYTITCRNKYGSVKRNISLTIP